MRSPNKSRSRNKNNNNNRRSNSGGNVINRVFDSSGPNGRVRGTPNQIVEKYQSLAHDALLSGDRVEAENYSQHAEHYIRILAQAQAEVAKEQAERQKEVEARIKRDAENNERSENNRSEHSDNEEPNDDVEKSKPRQSRSRSRKPLSDPRDDENKSEKTEAKVQTEPVDGFNSETAPDFLKSIAD